MNDEDPDGDFSPYYRIKDLLHSGSEDEYSNRSSTRGGFVPGKLANLVREHSAISRRLGRLYFEEVLLYNGKLYKEFFRVAPAHLHSHLSSNYRPRQLLYEKTLLQHYDGDFVQRQDYYRVRVIAYETA